METGDLHTHSIFSDGAYSPIKVASHMQNNRLHTFFSLTDHNTFSGLYELIDNADLIIKVVPGVEIETKTGEVLAYFPDFSYTELINTPLNDYLIDLRNDKNRIIEHCINKIISKGFTFTFDELIADSGQYDDVNLNSNHLKDFLYKKGCSIEEVEENVIPYYKNLKSGLKINELVDVIKLIVNSGGLPVIAHPWRNKFETEFRQMQLLVNKGLVGIESVGNITEKFKDKYLHVMPLLIQYHNDYDLVLTGGSDYHNSGYGETDFPGISLSVLENLNSKLKK